MLPGCDCALAIRNARSSANKQAAISASSCTQQQRGQCSSVQLSTGNDKPALHARHADTQLAAFDLSATCRQRTHLVADRAAALPPLLSSLCHVKEHIGLQGGGSTEMLVRSLVHSTARQQPDSTGGSATAQDQILPGNPGWRVVFPRLAFMSGWV